MPQKESNGLMRSIKITTGALALSGAVGGAIWAVAVWAEDREHFEEKAQSIHAQNAETHRSIAETLQATRELLKELSAESREKAIRDEIKEQCRKDPEACGIRRNDP